VYKYVFLLLFILTLSCFLWCFIRLSLWSCIYCFSARGGEIPKMCGWLMKTIQMIVRRITSLRRLLCLCHLIQSLKCVNSYILNLSFLCSFVDIYSFLGISCVFQRKKRRKKRKNKPCKRYVNGTGVKWTNVEGTVFHPGSCCGSFIGVVSWGFFVLILFCFILFKFVLFHSPFIHSFH
jgi:hypothetical protein